MIQSIIIAFQLLTIIPVPSLKKEADDAQLKRALSQSVAWYPLVGLFVGAVVYAVLQGLLLVSHSQENHLIFSAIVLVVWIVITGGLHLDGLIDSCDGLLCTKNVEQRLLIMKDPRVGAFGVIGAIVVVLLKFAALSELATDQFLWVLIIPVISRMCMSLSVVRYKTARNQTGMGSLFKAHSGWPQALIALGSTLGIVYLFCRINGFVLIGVAWLIMVATNWFIRKRINGLSGDTYGALNEIVETVLLVFVSLNLNRIFA